MRNIEEILRYAENCPKGDPVPITKSEIPVLSAFIQKHHANHGGLNLESSIRASLMEGLYPLCGHMVMVL